MNNNNTKPPGGNPFIREKGRSMLLPWNTSLKQGSRPGFSILDCLSKLLDFPNFESGT